VFEQFDAKNVDQDLQKCLLAYRNKGPKRDISPEIKARRDSTSFGWPATWTVIIKDILHRGSAKSTSGSVKTLSEMAVQQSLITTHPMDDPVHSWLVVCNGVQGVTLL